MERILRARLGVARVTIESTPDELKASVSKAQALAIKELMTRDPHMESVSAEGRAKLIDLAAAAQWAEGDRLLVMSLLLPKAKGKPDEKDGGGGNKGRRPLQHLAPALLSYFTQPDWDFLLSQAAFSEKTDMLMRRAIELSGRNLAEPTLKMMNSLSLVLTNDNAERLQTSVKKTYYDAFNKAFKAKARSLPAPPHYITCLPPVPGDLAKSHKELYEAAFPVAQEQGGGNLCHALSPSRGFTQWTTVTVAGRPLSTISWKGVRC